MPADKPQGDAVAAQTSDGARHVDPFASRIDALPRRAVGLAHPQILDVEEMVQCGIEGDGVNHRQQILGNCSPDKRSRNRRVLRTVVSTTAGSSESVTQPMTAA
ncbi:MAG: hypothetical protein KatS3mg082_0581 [Nitrospiraceae bacterium]|nr:MAG: hypothetical protein KatS3mg082_0581 [Nitrospiraceae bacterium]